MNLYSFTRNQEAMRRLFLVARDTAGNLQPLPAVYPDTMAPVVRVARSSPSPEHGGHGPARGRASSASIASSRF